MSPAGGIIVPSGYTPPMYGGESSADFLVYIMWGDNQSVSTPSLPCLPRIGETLVIHVASRGKGSSGLDLSPDGQEIRGKVSGIEWFIGVDGGAIIIRLDVEP